MSDIGTKGDLVHCLRFGEMCNGLEGCWNVCGTRYPTGVCRQEWCYVLNIGIVVERWIGVSTGRQPIYRGGSRQVTKIGSILWNGGTSGRGTSRVVQSTNSQVLADLSGRLFKVAWMSALGWAGLGVLDRQWNEGYAMRMISN